MKKRKALQRLAQRQRAYDALSSSAQNAGKRPGSVSGRK